MNPKIKEESKITKNRVLVLKIETRVFEKDYRKSREALHKKTHGYSGSMNDNDLKAFSVDDFEVFIKKLCQEDNLRRYIKFSFEERGKK